jgi:hypothetical protein
MQNLLQLQVHGTLKTEHKASSANLWKSPASLLRHCAYFAKIKLLLLFLLLSPCLQAQNRNAIGVNFIYGPKVIGQAGTYQGVGVSYIINTIYNEAQWARMLNVKSIVVDATFNDMENMRCGQAMAAYNPQFATEGYFGKHISLTGSIDIGIVKTDGFNILLSPTVGLLYSTKDYFNTGGVNQLIGTPLNALIGAKLKIELPVTANVNLQVGVGASHTSNSGTGHPNVGLTRISTSVGFLQNISYANVTTPKFCLPDNALSVELIAGYTAQQKTGFYQLNGVNLQLDKAYREKTSPIAKGALSFGYHHYLNDLVGVKAGADIIYSDRLSVLGSATRDTTSFIETYQGAYTPINSHFNVGLNAGIDLCLGRLVFGFSYGYYIGGYERYVYKHGGNKFEYGPLSYITYDAKYFITPKFAIAAKSFPHNFGGVGVNFSF